MTHRVLRRAIACALLASTALATPAFAQSAPAPVPLARSSIDENSVDVTTGKMQVTAAQVSIGQPGSGQLGLTWYLNSYVGPNSFAIAQSTTGGLVIGQSGKTFSGGVATDGSGETFAGGVYTMRDGTRISFTTLPAGQYYNNIYLAVGGYVSALASSITHPDGEVITINYRIDNQTVQVGPGYYLYYKYIRIQSVTSNRGYQVKYRYAYDAPATQSTYGPFSVITSVTAINNSVDYCSPTADACPAFTTSWPSQTFSSPNTTITDSMGRATEYTISSTTFAIKRPGSATNNLTASYDANGRVSSLTKDGVAYTYVFTLAGTVLTGVLSGPNGTIRTTTADTSTGAVLSEADGNNKTTTYLSDSYGRITKTTYPEGNYVSVVYDSRGNITQSTAVAKPGSGLANIVTTAGYDTTCTNPKTCNQPNWTKDAKGYETDYTYDPNTGQLLTATSPAPSGASPLGSGTRPQTRYAYTNYQAYYKNNVGSIVASGTPISLPTSVSQCQTGAICAGTADEAKTTISYGPQIAGTANNLLPASVSIGSGDGALTATSAFTWDNIGNQTTVDGPLSGSVDVAKKYYDSDGEVVGIVGPGSPNAKNRAQRISYNADGQATKVEAGTVPSQADSDWANFTPLQEVDTTYDTNARPVTQALASGGTTHALTQASYDNMGRLDCSAVRMNPAVFGSLPGSACTPGTQGSDGPDRITKMTYDANSRPVKATVAYATADQADERTLTYSDNGAVTSLTDSENNKTTYVYDGFDQLSQTQYPSATKGAGTSNSGDYDQLWYDANGNLTSRRSRSGGLINYGYDNLNRKIALSSSLLADRAYSYDLLGRQLTATFQSGGQGITNAYDALGRLTSSSSNVGGTAHALSYQYDLAGRRTQLTWWDGFYVNYDRLVTGELSKVRANGATSGAGVLATYAYDDLGRPISLTRGNGTVTTYSFDVVSRLTSLTHDLAGTANDLTIGTMTYNPAGQILATPRSNDAYAWTGHYNVNRGYTSNGLNQYTAAGPASFAYDANGNLTGDGTSTFTYDIENKLTNVTRTGFGATLSYDPLNRLDVYNPGTATRFIYDGSEVVAQLDASGNIVRRQVRGDGADEVLVEYNTSDWRYFHTDERGSTIGWSDPAGNAASILTYDEYGTPASSNPGFFQYTGQMWLPEIGIYNYKARMYSPTLGRFLQTDPIGYGDGPNWYAYTHNDPVNGTDPLGLQVDCGGVQATVCGHRPPSGGFMDGPASIGVTPGAYFGGFGAPAPRINLESFNAAFGNLRPAVGQNGNNLESRRKGERGWAGKNPNPEGKPNKGLKPVFGRPGWVQPIDPQTGRIKGNPRPAQPGEPGYVGPPAPERPNPSNMRPSSSAAAGVVGVLLIIACIILEPCGLVEQAQ
jgi:RHS repeat-associated protein